MNTFNIERAWERKALKRYTYISWAIDLHGTIIPPSYSYTEEHLQLYPYAKEVLQFLTAHEEMNLILWTSTHKEKLASILKWLWDTYSIRFNYINCNPECSSTALCDFNHKFHFDVLLDDKAGFEPEKDWELIWGILQRLCGKLK